MDDTLVASAALLAVAGLGLLVRRLGQVPRTPELPAPPAPIASGVGPAPSPDPAAAGAPVDAPRDAAPEKRDAAPGKDAEEDSPGPTAPARSVTEAVDRPETPAEPEVDRLRRGLAGTRGGFVARLARLFGGAGGTRIDGAVLEEVEEVLLSADLGVRTADRLLGQLRERADGGDLEDPWAVLREEAQRILGTDSGGVKLGPDRPAVVLVVGVNGVGKTTTIGKLGAHLTHQGRRVVLAAGATFRAAAIPQLESRGRRIGAPVVSREEGADPGSVIFDAVRQATDEGADVVIADTAGRLHTKTPLMDELRKVHRTATKALGGRAPDELLLVLDATTGQNAVQQARLFKEALPLTGLVLTKLDGTAKGGVVLGVVDEHGLPVRYVGIGERVDDLREFDPETFVAALFEKPGDATMAA